ncbi:hypothetical protein [Vampirovibrio sp.]|uniref:hypothetical protein n=1 Tax=Vampirovibrio sp. TaxID=2717857 RepID=UPI003593A36E
MLQQQGLSHRQACHLAGISRSVDKYVARNPNEALVARMRELAFEHIWKWQNKNVPFLSKMAA